MKKIVWVILFPFLFSSLLAEKYAKELISWKEVRSQYNWQIPPTFLESETVDLFESILYSEGRILIQTKDSTKQSSILVWNLASKEATRLPWEGGKVTGWTECRGNLLFQTANTLWEMNPQSFAVQRKLVWPDKGKSWKDIVCLENQIYRLDKNQLEVYNWNTGELVSQIPLPFPSVQRITKRNESEIFLISSFWGNTVQVFSPKKQMGMGEFKFPVTHRALFKLAAIGEDQYIIFDPLTKTYGEWKGYGNSIFPLTTPLEVADGNKVFRFSPIQNQIEYQFQWTALVDLPETKIHFVLPKEDTASQVLREETFSSDSKLEVDESGNRLLVLNIPSRKAGDIGEITVYRALLTRYKIQWNLDPDLSIPQNQNSKLFANYLQDDWFLKINSPTVTEKRNSLFQESSNLKDVLLKTQEYVASIPYKSGSFEPAPQVIEKNNGGCTEHSYVTMALLRGKGIPSRLVWNYLPTETANEITFNHKFVEVWVEGLGWIPMEPLAPPKSKPGVTYARHVVFATLSNPTHPQIAGGDRLVQLAKESLSLGKKIKFKLVVSKSEVGKEVKGPEEKEEGIVPLKTNRALLKGEDLLVP
ncbi:transglutaminase-like domain-containing protein [Leptospira terpstrae]|uniref:Transglutaminase-like protein n=1 Tax=Leptospira terpstrae serovar Hualin str. LT 11-33 = ATCC 700639 TaxID=1257025 RepID=N1VWM3_9LEPT|nr:transglutaminase-like domain-containing protein [Leptospira terpstrae]EMY61187.1 transglutaminase-like protein [Leptospira terpstrae serovar Hualin str. LT 11-33 = ATCC 700639]